MAVTIQTNARGWREVTTTAFWTARVLWDTGAALYAVVQDTGATPKVRVMKANSRTNPTSWSEQDSANNKTITNVDYPFDSWLHTNGDLHIVVLTATNTSTHYVFDTDTDAWATGNGNVTTATSNERPIRVTVRSDGDILVVTTSSVDDADLFIQRWEGVSWGQTTLLGIASAEASTIANWWIDSTDRAVATYYNVADDDFEYKTFDSANVLTAAVDLELTGPATETGHSAGGRFNLYVDGAIDKIIAAYINSSPAIDERILTLESDAAAGNAATEAAVESTTTDVGTRTPVSTAVLSGTPYAAWWDDANSGTIKYSTKSGGAWAAETNFATGITNLIEIVPVSTGLAVVYQSGSDVVMDWIIAPPITISVPVMTATAAGVAPASQISAASPLMTASATLRAPAIQLSAAVPVSTASAAMLTPDVLVDLLFDVPVMIATADAPAPAVTLVSAPPVATGDGAMFAPDVRIVTPSPVLSGNGAMLVPDVLVDLLVSVPLLTADAAMVAPGMRLVAPAPVALADVAGTAPAVHLLTAVPLSPISAAMIDPAVGVSAQVPAAAASGAMLSPGMLLSMGTPVMAATGDLIAPGVWLVVGPPVMAATGELLIPTIDLGSGAPVTVVVPVMTATGLMQVPLVLRVWQAGAPLTTFTAGAQSLSTFLAGEPDRQRTAGAPSLSTFLAGEPDYTIS